MAKAKAKAKKQTYAPREKRKVITLKKNGKTYKVHHMGVSTDSRSGKKMNRYRVIETGQILHETIAGSKKAAKPKKKASTPVKKKAAKKAAKAAPAKKKKAVSSTTSPASSPKKKAAPKKKALVKQVEKPDEVLDLELTANDDFELDELG